MAAQFLLNILIAFLWMLFVDQDELLFSTFAAGFLVGVVIVFLMHRFFGERFYLHKLYCAIKLVLIFISELLKSSVVVIKHILSPKLDLYPGIFKYKTDLKTDGEVTTLALLLTLTPGSVVMEITPEGNELYVHAMDIEKYRDDLIQSLKRFEKAIKEVTR